MSHFLSSPFFQFWGLQFLILIGAFSKGVSRKRAPLPRHKLLKGKAFLFAIEGILMLVLAWIWRGEAKNLPVYYIVSGIIWLLAGIFIAIYLYRANRQGKLADKY